MKLLLLTVLLGATVGVDKSNFKTCDQSSFCKRQRATTSGHSSYRALLNTVQVDESGLKVQLLNSNNGVLFLLEFIVLKGNTARVKLNELKPMRPRYEPLIGDVLVSEPLKDSVKVEDKDSSHVTLTFQNNKAIIQANPFRIDFIADNEPVVSINSQGLLNFEHYRQKPGASDDNEPEKPADEENDDAEHKEHEEEEEEKEEKDDENGMWEETFKSHHDSKPYGPSSVGLDIAFPGCEFVYGIPEHADTLALKSTKNTDPYRLYNLDVFEYELNNPMALYGSIPVMLAHNEKKTVGVFWLNVAETWVDISSNIADKGTFSKLVDFVKGDSEIPLTDTHWFSESGIIDVFVMLGPTAKDVFQQYAALTGTTPLPPLFGIAYHQSRWNYNDQTDVANVNAGFDEHDIPMDVIWLDIEHTDGKRYFTWDEHKFPESADMIQNVSAHGRKMVTIVDPHIKRDSGYHIHKEAEERALYVKNKDGNSYDGWCWPGSSSWLDFLDPSIRQFWASKFLTSIYEGSTPDLYIWNDMNEPSVFNGPEITMHKDAKHFADWEHRDVHNLYGMLVHRATYEGLLQRGEHKDRPFVLSRALFAGSQRYGAIWTGDNTGEWGHLKITLPMVLSLNLVGITFSGADIGGFFKNPDNELLTRWYQAAAYQPFMRAHAHLDTKRREPWLLPEEHKVAIREAIAARYRLLPYWYTLFYQSEQHGGPVMQPMWVEFPDNKKTFAMEDQHMLGAGMLVAPVLDQGVSSVSVFLPGTNEVWYDRDTYQKYAGDTLINVPVSLNKIPTFQRGGHIIPTKQRQRRASSLTYRDPYTLIVALDKQGQASGELYYDDYQSFEYKQGHYVHRQLSFASNKLVSKNLNPHNTGWLSEAWLERVIIVGLPRQPTTIHITGEGIEDNKLDAVYSPDTQLLTIRKPGVNMASNFVISLQ